MSSLEYYINSLPTQLSKQEQKELFIEYQNTKSLTIRNKIIAHNLRLAVNYALRYFKETTPFEEDDLVQIATIGLTNAVETYNLNSGNEFSTYATTCVRNYILYTIKANTKTERTRSATTSINNLVVNDKYNRNKTFEELLIDDSESHIEKDFQTKQDCKHLQKYVFKKYGEKEYNIFCDLFGLDGHDQGQTYQQVASKYNTSHQNIALIKQKILSGLREYYLNIPVQKKSKKKKVKLQEAQAE